MHTRPALDAADARAMIEAGSAEAGRLGFAVSLAVVDEAGMPMAMLRLDGARLHTPDAAIAKARTAAITRTPTSELQQQTDAHPSMLAFPGRLPLTGGLPVLHQGAVVGGVGSSGGSPEQDLALCHAMLAALGPGATT